MNKTFLYLIGILVLLFQAILSEFLSLNGVRPDFILIFILYISVNIGSFHGVLSGFLLGVLSDFLGIGSAFGISPLTYTLTGYLLGIFCNQNKTTSQLRFHTVWIGIINLHFLCTTFIRYQITVIENPLHYVILWICTSLYTLGFIGILQIIHPIYKNH
jgi:rod shape-determining protein MreD